MLGDSLRRRRGPGKESRPEAEKAPVRPRPRRSSGLLSLSIWQWLLAGLVVLTVSFGVGYLLSTQMLFPRPETAGTGIAVPSLYGETRADAEAALREAGLDPGDVVELASLETDAGRVLAQEPIPGLMLRRGASVSFAVSAGPPELRVPPVRGMGPESARELLEEMGFDVDMRRVRAEGVTDEVVVETDPAAGVARTLPVTITLLVNEPPTDTVGPSAEDTVADGAGMDARP